MANLPYYDGKHSAPRQEVSSDEVARLRARAAELGLAVPATSRRIDAEELVRTLRAEPRRAPLTLPIRAAITTPHELAVSQLDLQGGAPLRWWRAIWRSLIAPLRR